MNVGDRSDEDEDDEEDKEWLNEDESEEGVVDLSDQQLLTVRLPPHACDAITLILDNNNISKLDGLDLCTSLNQVTHTGIKTPLIDMIYYR